MKTPVPGQPMEPRWPAALTIIVVLSLLTVLPDQVRLVPVWVHYLLGITLLVAMATVPLTGAKAQWLRFERIILLLFCFIGGIGTLISLTYLIDEMINPSKELNGIQLLSSSIAVWIDNVLVFSLLYWQLDRGGPEARLNNSRTKPDWFFPQVDLPEDVMPDWRPIFVDYLFLAYTTATAFSPTDVLPLTPSAKILMMLESLISLATILVVVSRAINILGS
jgi:uncharacterized membrane protein